MGKVLVAPANFGLGHATRDIPIIKELLKHGHQVHIATGGAALNLLKKEFPRLTFHILPEYSQALQSADRIEKTKLLKEIAGMIKAFRRENKVILDLVDKHKYDMIISDGRYGVYSKSVPSFMISHQLIFKPKAHFRRGAFITEMFNDYYFQSFEKVIVPDNYDDAVSLSGEISRPKIPWFKKRTYYAGVLSSIEKVSVKKDIDVLISISGPEPFRTDLEKLALSKLGTIKGRKVVLLGKPGVDGSFTLSDGTIVHNHVSRSEMTKLFNRAKMIVSRSGYTTVMELADLGGKKALFIPTPGSTEQEFLAERYMKKKWVYCVDQEGLDFTSAIKKAYNYPGLPKMSGTAENVSKLYEEVFSKYI